jgi:hypothetical protein
MYTFDQSTRPSARRFACVAAMVMGVALALTGTALAATSDSTTTNLSAPPETPRAKSPIIVIDNFRAHDARGLNVFEAPKASTIPYEGFQIQWGAAFTQQFQDLTHQNTAAPNIVGGVNLNKLIDIGPGFNNADANLYLDTQLGRGMRMALTMYLSSRHHNETWVKDGYLLIDGSPWENETLDNLMKYVTLKLGHMEINYGDMHFRRSDNGQTMFNPLIGNLIMDAFTTEIGGELYVRGPDAFGMFSVTGGEVHGLVTNPEARSPSYIGKLGYDKQLNEKARVRLTGSIYTTKSSVNNTLYSGSRAGSRYYFVLENVNATETGQAWSGDIQPGQSDNVTAWVVNPFIKFQGLELFGNIEQSKGRKSTETVDRKFTQNAGEVVYRFLKNQLYVAGRYDQVKGRPAGAAFTQDVTVERTQTGGGWFLTQNMLAKVEYVQQNYMDYPVTDIHNGGQFKGVMFEAVVSF